MQEKPSFIEKYAKRENFKLPKFPSIKIPKINIKIPPIKLNPDLIYNYFVLIVLVVLTVFKSLSNKHLENIDRYTIINGNYDPTILLDKKTGLTWRNVNCEGKEKIPNCWQLMENDEYYTDVPIGEVTRRAENSLPRGLKLVE